MSSSASPQADRRRSRRPFHIPKTIKRLFAKAPSPVLTPVLQIVVAASAAFGPLQAAAGSLLRVMEIVEVCRCSSFYSQNNS